MRTKFAYLLGIIVIPFIIHKIYYSFITIDNVPTGYYIESLNSNNGKYTLKSYWIYDDFRIEGKIRVELVNNETNEVKNIYYNYPENKVIMKWLNDKKVLINNKVLIINKTTYDYRNEFKLIKGSKKRTCLICSLLYTKKTSY